MMGASRLRKHSSCNKELKVTFSLSFDECLTFWQCEQTLTATPWVLDTSTGSDTIMIRNNPDWKLSYQFAAAHTYWLHLPFMAVPIFCITNSRQDFAVPVCVQKIWACDSIYLSLRSSHGRKASGGWSKHSKWVNPPPVVLSNNPWKCANGPKVPSFRSAGVKKQVNQAKLKAETSELHPPTRRVCF